MNAGRLLRRAGYDVDELRSQLTPIEPDSVNVWPASAWLRKMWRPGIRGVTLSKWVFVDPALFGDNDELARLVIHELVHVRQFAETGVVRFVTRYVRDYLAGRQSGLSPRDAYRAIDAEVEAREFTSRVT